jgi:uncharacterized RDD family membrane protein YckC
MYKNTFGRVPTSSMINVGFWRRCAAQVIDGFIIAFISFVAGIVLGVVLVAAGVRDASASRIPGYIVGMAISWLYFALQESSAVQASLGKRAFGLKVVDERGQRIEFGRATFRFFGKILSGLILGIGFLMAGLTPRKQALHDIFAGTFVVFRAANPGQPIPSARPRMPWYGWVLNAALLAYPVVVFALAFPAYGTYMLRVQVVEGVIAGDAAKTEVADFYSEKGRCPKSGAEVGFDESSAGSRYVDSVTIQPNCTVTVTFNSAGPVRSALRGQQIDISGQPNPDGILTWTCGGTVAAALLPQSCHK